MKTALRRTVQAGTAGLFVGGVVLLAAAPAAAHVTVTPTETSAGSYTVLTVSVPHGCDGAGTTKVAIKIPEDIIAVTPTVNTNWTVQKVMADLNPPVKDSHGNEVTQRVNEVVYTARAPLPDDMRDTFELSLKLPDTPGKTLVFPSVQTCEKGETAWVQVPADGQNADDLEHPAPGFKVTEAAKEGDEAPAANANTALTGAQSDAGDSDSGGTSAVSWIALAAGILGLLLGGFAVLRPNLTKSRDTTA
ncbi:YcnI family protein [Phytohabitans sp. ZYX-F-186]|uniref:YcnI family protein n=1 Tax=Phytohabitans maris TaxID=3071409 RepID=A0ABU0ZG13_9ACTN|nr:YcnI family protein [Phytohabitans sp. ZYX-F-186]MDQ7905210.1 YcnI family protein [Phytohabitans sp. ZYX-F-186]